MALYEEDDLLMEKEPEEDSPAASRPITAGKKLWGKLTRRVCCPGFTSRECQGMPRSRAVRRLQEAGFYKITAVACQDLTYRKRELLDTVVSVTLGGEEQFQRNSEFPFDTKIEVRYHSFKQIPVGFSPQVLRKANVCETRDYFKRQGFGRIRMVPIYDLKVGWLKIDGQLESVLMDGFNHFHADSEFSADSEITLYYHTFRK